MIFRWPLQILLLVIVVIGLYFPTSSAEVSLVDDQDAITKIYNSDSISIKEIFLPRSFDGGYYRPLIGLNYYMDKMMWGMDIRSMHIENIMMHLVNVILVYLLALVVCRENAGKSFNRLVPMSAALLFALHPICTESINWISGRTDPLAANFVLPAAILLIIYQKSRKTIYVVPAFVMMLLGMLAKEASLGMFLASGIILYSHGTANYDENNEIQKALSWHDTVIWFLVFYSMIVLEVLYVGNYWFVIVAALGYAILITKPWLTFRANRELLSRKMLNFALMISISVGISFAVYLLLRMIAFRSDVSKIGQTVKLMCYDTNYALSVFLGAAGFYFKKFILPLPLNFYILEIDPLYDLLGILLLLFCIFLLTRRTVASVLFLAGVCMFLPALPFAFGTIAWTGYAERYVYISAAFWSVSCAIYLDSLAQRYRYTSSVCMIAVPAMLFFLGWQTFSRNMVWRHNVTLLADTVEKSPKREVVREMYMQALYNAGRYDLVKEQYATSKSRSIMLSENADLMIARILAMEGNTDDALALNEAVVKKHPNSDRALLAAIDLIEKMIEKGKSKKQILLKKKTLYGLQILKVSKDPMLLYTMGQKAIGVGDNLTAIECFDRANKGFPQGSPYKGYSSRLIASLQKSIPPGKASR